MPNAHAEEGEATPHVHAELEMLSRLKFSDHSTVPSAVTPRELTPLNEGLEMCTVPGRPFSRDTSSIDSLTASARN